MEMPTPHALPSLMLALMSGTSVDSIDAALCRVWLDTRDRLGADLVAFHEAPVVPPLRARLLQLFRDEAGSLSLACSLNFELGEAFAEAARQLLLRLEGNERVNIAAVASHGQTVYHIPPQLAAQTGCAASTLQLGAPAVIAQRLGLPVVADFRSADMAVGGQGAPLVPFADYHMFARADETIVIHNIGGIANCTVLPSGGSLDDVLAFDTGPGNVLIDALVMRFFAPMTYDHDGRIAASGRTIEALLDRWMALPFILAPPPKSTGRELFGPQLIEQAVAEFPSARPEDLVATATRFTARSFAANLAQFVSPQHAVAAVYLAGGGARNPVLRACFAEELRRALGAAAPRVEVLDALGLPAKARECVAFALLGYARLLHIPANVPRATGATRAVTLGTLYEP
jgi:anhydro-N-acetylmuramic acid kinase